MIEIAVDGDLDSDTLGPILAEIDDGLLGVVETSSGVQLFFADGTTRDRALGALRTRWPALECAAGEVSDEDWAARSQANLGSIVVGEFSVCPPWDLPTDPLAPYVVIQPSMGFGTGHHASTRICLRLMLELPEIQGRSVLDIGTGSGLLAVMTVKLGAGPVVAIDIDADALQSARENIELNDMTGRIDVRLVDVTDATTLRGETFDLVLANLTGAMLARDAGRLAALTAPRGRVIASGFQGHELDDVTSALADAGLRRVETQLEDEWIGALFVRSAGLQSRVANAGAPGGT